MTIVKVVGGCDFSIKTDSREIVKIYLLILEK